MIRKDIAKTITFAALRAARSAQHAVLFKRLIDTSTELYISAFGTENMKLMDSLPKGWFETRADFGVRFSGERRTLFFTNTYGTSITPLISIQYGNSIRFPRVHISDNFDGEDKGLKASFAQASDDYFAFKKEIDGLREKTEATLRGFTNLKVLAAQWPEMAPYIPAGLPVTQATGKALFNPASLNAQIGLPPE